MDIKENLATNLIKYRKAHGLTQLDLAEKLNYSPQHISYILNGKRNLTVDMAISLTEIFNNCLKSIIRRNKNVY